MCCPFHLCRHSCLAPCCGDPKRCCDGWKRRPVTLKSRADHTDHAQSSQDCVTTIYSLDLTGVIRTAASQLWSDRRTAKPGRVIGRKIRDRHGRLGRLITIQLWDYWPNAADTISVSSGRKNVLGVLFSSAPGETALAACPAERLACCASGLSSQPRYPIRSAEAWHPDVGGMVVLASLFHQLLLKDGLLRWMWFGQRA